MKEYLSIDEEFISNIFQKYLKAKIILKNEANSLQEKTENYGGNNDFEKKIDYQNHLEIVETILSLMPKAEYNYLVSEFLVIKKSNIWWKKCYSQDSYYKLKQKAISRFLYLFLI